VTSNPAGIWIALGFHAVHLVLLIPPLLSDPGPIDTPGLRHALQGVQDVEKLMTTSLNALPLGRFGNPDDIANAVTFLASNDSSFVTGIELSVDGGMAQI